MINGIGSYGGYMSYLQTQSMNQQRGGPADMFSKVDSDGSGGISQAELDTFVEEISGVSGEAIDTTDALTTYDTDGDGELSDEELRAFLDASGLQPPSRRGMGMMGMQQGPPPGGMFDDADSDGSGGISQTELETLAEQISEKTGNTIDTEDAVSVYDTDGDGELSSEELAAYLEASGLQPPSRQGMGMAGMGGPNPAAMFDDADSDGSGGISEVELETLAATIADKTGIEIDTTDAVSSYDTDGDGELSSEELAAYLDANGLQPPEGPMHGMAMSGMMSPSFIGNAMNTYQMNGAMDISGLMDMLATRGGVRSFLNNPLDFLA